MHKDTESYPTVCVGWILTYPLCGGPQDHQRRGSPVDWLAGCNECIKVSTVTLSPRLCQLPSTALFL